MQGVLGSFFRMRSRIDDFQTPEQLTAFLAAMAHNKVLFEQRRFSTQKRELKNEISLEDLPDGESEPADPQPSHVEMAMLQDNWDHVLNGHCDRDRRIVELRMAGRTWPQIEETLDVSQGHAQRIVAGLLREVFDGE